MAELIEVFSDGSEVPVVRSQYTLSLTTFTRNFTLMYKHKNTSEIEKEYVVRLTAFATDTDYPYIAEKDYMIGVMRYDQDYPLQTVPLTAC